MSQKVRQLTDNIHDTIFLSSFESEMIATPYFNRLHDIYQNSTVYTAFPSNRTKRYEHSLGTMKIASYMLFSAISNADDDVRSEIFESLKQHFKRILKKIYEEGENVDARYFASYYDEYSALFSSFKNDDDDDESSFDNLYSDTMNEIANALRTNAFVDEALDNYQYYNVNIKNATNDEDGVVDNTESSKSGYMVHEYNIEHIFLYRCLLQALRIVALYHDAGHPPMSHILEDVITNVYEQAAMHYKKGEWDSEKLDKCIKSLKPYIKQGSGKPDKCDDEQVRYRTKAIYASNHDVLEKADFHEKVGLNFLEAAFQSVIKRKMDRLSKESNNNLKMVQLLYYILVVEFSVAMLVEFNEYDELFPSMHAIVDGIIDADRLDYIVRDSVNSGVDWGSIPYDRIIRKSKMIAVDSCDSGLKKRSFVIAFQEKVSDDIADILVTRYKLFTRVNFHHRCVRTAVDLKNAVYELSINYLQFSSKESKKIYCKNIQNLWNALSTKVQDKGLKIVRWNDSWLISCLQDALIGISDKNEQLKEYLEEFLLDKKKYSTLIKRGTDIKKLINKILEYSKITEDNLNNLVNREMCNYLNCNENSNLNDEDILSSPKLNARDSILRARSKALRSSELQHLEQILPLKSYDKTEYNFTIVSAIEEALESEKNRKDSKMITDYEVQRNEGKAKYGLPKHDSAYSEIYLYDKKGQNRIMDIEPIKQQLFALSSDVPEIYVYVALTDKTEMVPSIRDELIDRIAQHVATSIKGRFEELFECKP